MRCQLRGREPRATPVGWHCIASHRVGLDETCLRLCLLSPGLQPAQYIPHSLDTHSTCCLHTYCTCLLDLAYLGPAQVALAFSRQLETPPI
jgi:hypothetical protein